MHFVQPAKFHVLFINNLYFFILIILFRLTILNGKATIKGNGKGAPYEKETENH